VETYLAFGASRFEACRPIATEALKVALTPNLNQMSVIGLISIPGPYSVSCLLPYAIPSSSPGAPSQMKVGVADGVGYFDLNRDDDGSHPWWKFCGPGTPVPRC